MPDPSAVNANPKPPNVATSSASDDERSFAGSPFGSQNRETPNFSRPLPLSPPGSLRSIVLPRSAVVDNAQAVMSDTSPQRPLPSVPGHTRVYPARSLENIQGGRGSGLGTRIIDDRDPDDLTILSLPFLPLQHRNTEEDGQTSTAGASDSELLYASAPSTPLHVSSDSEVAESAGATARVSAHEAEGHVVPERRATVALGESRHNTGQDLVTPKRAVTMDHFIRGDQEFPNPVPDTRGPEYGPDDHSEDGLEYADGVDPYLKDIVERFGEGPSFPEPLAQGRLASTPTFPQPQHQSQPIVLGFPIPELPNSSPSQDGKNFETASPSMPSAISFPIPSQEQEGITWKPNLSFIPHDKQTSGTQSVSSYTSQFPLPVIAGTNLQFEPLPPLQRTDSGMSDSTHGEGIGYSNKPGPPPLTPTRPGSLSGEVSPPSSQIRQEHSNPANIDATQHRSDSGDSVNSPKEVTSIAPLRILKHSQIPPYSPGIPPGAAVPTPPGSSLPGSPDRSEQNRDMKPPIPDAPVPRLPTPQAQRSLGSNTANATPQNLNFVPVEASAGAPRQASMPVRVAGQTSTSHMGGEAKLDAGASTPSLNAPGLASSLPGPVKPVLEGNVNPNLRPQGLVVSSSEPAAVPVLQKGNKMALKRENGSTGPGVQNSESQRAHPGDGRLQAQSLQQRSQSGPQSPPQLPSRSQQMGSTQQIQAPPPVPEPQRRPPHLDTEVTPSTSPTRGRHSHGDSISSQQPRTLAEEKAQYSAVPPASRSTYMNMLLALDDIPMTYNLLASFFTWILLAGFVLFPGTFTTLQTVDLGSGVGAALVHRIVNLPLFVVAFICTGIGILGMGYLWWRWMKNYIWLVNKIFLPGLMNSLAGVLSTVVNVYGVQHGVFVTPSIVTISVTGGVGVVCGLLTLWYGVWLLGRIKRRHVREVGIEKAGKHGEGVWIGLKAKFRK